MSALKINKNTKEQLICLKCIANSKLKIQSHGLSLLQNIKREDEVMKSQRNILLKQLKLIKQILKHGNKEVSIYEIWGYLRRQ